MTCSLFRAIPVSGHDSVVPGFSPGCEHSEHRAVKAGTGFDFLTAVGRRVAPDFGAERKEEQI